jgi:hypothetical protein
MTVAAGSTRKLARSNPNCMDEGRHSCGPAPTDCTIRKASLYARRSADFHRSRSDAAEESGQTSICRGSVVALNRRGTGKRPRLASGVMSAHGTTRPNRSPFEMSVDAGKAAVWSDTVRGPSSTHSRLSTPCVKYCVGAAWTETRNIARLLMNRRSKYKGRHLERPSFLVALEGLLDFTNRKIFDMGSGV